MKRVAVIGNAGGGKSTMCRKLSAAQDLPLFPVDRMQWRPGWQPAAPEVVKQQHDQVLRLERWIIDGWGSFDLIEARFQAADTIIFVDHPLAVHYWWALKRQFACLFAPRPDGPEGCPMLPMTWPLLKMIWRIHHQLRPRLLGLVEQQAGQDGKQVFHLTSPRQLRRFVEQYCQERRQGAAGEDGR